MSKVFIDTNVLVYSVDERDPAKQAQARERIRQAEAARAGVISTQILQEFFAVVTRRLGLAADAAVRLVNALPRFDVVILDVPLIRKAMELCGHQSISLWDALVVVAARHARCGVLWTEDLSHGQVVGSVRIENPFLGEGGQAQHVTREASGRYRLAGRPAGKTRRKAKAEVGG